MHDHVVHAIAIGKKLIDIRRILHHALVNSIISVQHGDDTLTRLQLLQNKSLSVRGGEKALKPSPAHATADCTPSDCRALRACRTARCVL